MKYTDTIQIAIDYMKEVGTVSKIKQNHGTPHEFTSPNEKIVMDGYYIKLPTYSRRINRQTLNRLVMLGYAEYTDKIKETAVFIDKDFRDREIGRKAIKYEQLYEIVDHMLFKISTQFEPGMDIDWALDELRKFMSVEREDK